MPRSNGSFETEAELEEALSRPTAAAVEALSRARGDVVVLGAGGKMGPTLARMARRALDEAGAKREVIAVARFSDAAASASLEAAGVRTVRADLLDAGAVRGLPEAGAVFFLAGAKFGTSGAEARTWATNVWAAGLAAERYAGVPTVAFSTGNVYPLVPVDGGGATEATPPAPVGEYAQSALGRERLFEFFSRERGTPAVVFRLNYAVELRYGVLLDLARKVAAGEPIDLSMGHVNCIWQGDANAFALASLAYAASPPFVVNVTGSETLTVRSLAVALGDRLGRSPRFEGREQPTALLASAARARSLFGEPAFGVERALDAVARWVARGGRTLGKPTRFERRDGRF